MNVRTLLLMFAAGQVQAQVVPLPPVEDYSTHPTGSSYTPKPSSTVRVYELLARLEQLQTEVQQLRGTLEEQGYAITQLKKRQNSIYADLDQRLQALETGGAAAATTQPGTPAAQTAAAESAPAAAQKPAGPAPAVTAPAPATATAEDKAPETEKERYQQAYETLKNGHYSQAINAFKQFLNDYPAGDYADNAQYWLGEAYKVNRDIEAARAAFNKVVTDFPRSPKVPDALLKLGYIEYDRNNTAEARDYFSRITVSFPGTTAAHLAAKKLQQMDNNP